MAVLPNILLIILDDCNYEMLNWLPQVHKRLATKGVVFTNCITSTAECVPARVAMLSGQFAHNSGVLNNGHPWQSIDHSTMMPRRLQLAGYATTMHGKWLNTWLANDSIPVGYTEWSGHQPANYFEYEWNFNGVVTHKGSNDPTDYNTHFLSSWFRGRLTSYSQPWFAWLGYKAPHFQLPDTLGSVPSKLYAGCVSTSKKAPRHENFNNKGSGKPAHIQALPQIDDATIARIDAFYRGEREEMFTFDSQLAETMDLVEALAPNTVMILTSDNGYFHGELTIPDQKVHPYEPAIHVPLIISGPSALIDQGKIHTGLVSLVDIAPTIFALSGATPGVTPDGVSLAGVMLNPEGPPVRSSLLSEWLPSGTPVPKYRLMRSATAKYIDYFETGEKELYDLRRDPGEMDNMAGKQAYAAVQSDLAAKLAVAAGCVGGTCVIT